MISLLIIFLLFLITAIFVLQPLFLDQLPDLFESETSLPALQQRKKILYRQIKELDLDYKMGKILEKDYHETRIDLKRDVAEIMIQIKNPT